MNEIDGLLVGFEEGRAGLLAVRDGLLVELGDALGGGVDALGDGAGLGLGGHVRLPFDWGGNDSVSKLATGSANVNTNSVQDA